MPATQEQIAKALGSSSPWSPGVKSLIKWRFGLHGDFYSALWNAIKVADQRNLGRIALGFPEEIEAFNQWSYGDLGEILRESGLGI